MDTNQSPDRLLVVDQESALFRTEQMIYREYASDYLKIRDYSREIISDSPVAPAEVVLLEQQISEIIKNAVYHGNHSDPGKIIKVWYKITGRFAHLIVEDQGAGFAALDRWNDFYTTRKRVLESSGGKNSEKYLSWYSYLGQKTNHTGGVALLSAVEYWNGGIVFNKKKNKIALLRKF